MSKVESGNQQGIVVWQKRLTDEVFKGPSADPKLPINHLCYEAYRIGLLPEDGKFGLVWEVAAIMNYVQTDGQPPKSLEGLDLDQIARAISREPKRIKVVADLMVQFNFISTNTKKHS